MTPVRAEMGSAFQAASWEMPDRPSYEDQGPVTSQSLCLRREK